jgi:Sigma-70, region 4
MAICIRPGGDLHSSWGSRFKCIIWSNPQRRPKMQYPTCPSDVERNAIAYEETLRLETSIQAQVPDVVYDDLELSAVLARALRTLDPIEERILRMLHGIGLWTEFTIGEISVIFGLSVEETRMITKRAIRKMLHPSRARRLRDWLSQHQTGAAALRHRRLRLRRQAARIPRFEEASTRLSRSSPRLRSLRFTDDKKTESGPRKSSRNLTSPFPFRRWASPSR